MRLVALALVAVVAVPALAQVSIDAHGIRSGAVRIDGTGVHSGSSSVTRRGVRTGGGHGGTTINGNDAMRAIDCGGGSLTVNGNRNRITARECRQITLTGNRNRLRWHRTGGASAISNVGNGNGIVRF